MAGLLYTIIDSDNDAASIKRRDLDSRPTDKITTFKLCSQHVHSDSGDN